MLSNDIHGIGSFPTITASSPVHSAGLHGIILHSVHLKMYPLSLYIYYSLQSVWTCAVNCKTACENAFLDHGILRDSRLMSSAKKSNTDTTSPWFTTRLLKLRFGKKTLRRTKRFGTSERFLIDKTMTWLQLTLLHFQLLLHHPKHNTTQTDQF